MKRRTFLAATAAAVALAAIPFVKYKWGGTTGDPLLIPDTLTNFCDDVALREIGEHYRKLYPENNRKKLTELLLSDNSGKVVGRTNQSAISKLLKKKIQDDFLTERTIVLNGWVISTTEARQCALYSLT